MARQIETAMPAMLAHEGIWEGRYRHLDANDQLLDEHESRVICTFPDEGPYAYVQHNLFRWADGREYRVELPGMLKGQRLYWDTPTFSGYAWQTDDDLILLHLDRKDEPGVEFFEVIVLGSNGISRARTWHWFKNGELIRRTLCNERRTRT